MVQVWKKSCLSALFHTIGGPHSVNQESAFQVSKEQYMGENLRAWYRAQREIPMDAESIIQKTRHICFSVFWYSELF